MSPQTPILPQSDTDGPLFFAQKQSFYRNFISETDSMNFVNNEQTESFKLIAFDYTYFYLFVPIAVMVWAIIQSEMVCKATGDIVSSILAYSISIPVSTVWNT